MRLFRTSTVMLLTLTVLTTSSTVFAVSELPKQLTKKPIQQVAVAKVAVPTPTAPAPDKVIAVQPGDYLEKIAGENQTTSLRLFYANTDIANPDLIFPNQQRDVRD